jgi:hypothetical protein
MKTYEYGGDVLELARSHPWTTTRTSPEHRYYDLKAEPARIRTSLEDVVPWARYPAAERLYALLEWLNGPTSPLESNDCALVGPAASESAEARGPLECSGRVMILFRDLARNVEGDDLRALTSALHHALARVDRVFSRGAIGTTLVPVDYLALPVAARHGAQLMLSFWAWGRSEQECMASLERVLGHLDRELRAIVAPC